MSSSFRDSFDEMGAASYGGDSTHPFHGEGGYSNSVEESADDSTIFNNTSDGFFSSNPAQPIHAFEANGDPVGTGVFFESDGPILPPRSEMQEEGSVLREWRRQNAVLLEQKEKKEKEVMSQIIEEAKDFKAAFHEKRKGTCENNKNNNREKEKLFVANQERFHKEADANYWKAIAELIPNEVPAIEKKRGKKDQEKKPSVTVIQGPKPGKPTDLARMRQVLVKLKHTTPAHLRLAPPLAATAAKDGKAEGSKPAAAAVVAAPEAVVAA